MNKTFTGPELAQALRDKQLEEGTILKNMISCKFIIGKCGEELSIYRYIGGEKREEILAVSLVCNTFTIVEEPTLYYFNQVRKWNKKVRIDRTAAFRTIPEMLRMLGNSSMEVINVAFTKRIWEIEE